MPKIHTRLKRKIGLSTKHKHYFYFHTVVRKHRPKTFMTVENADKWAAEHGLKLGEYSLKSAKKGKRFQVVGV